MTGIYLLFYLSLAFSNRVMVLDCLDNMWGTTSVVEVKN